MSNWAILAATIKTSLQDAAKQSSGLATGLENAAPGDKKGSPNNSVEYLHAITKELEKSAALCEQLISTLSQAQLKNKR